MQHISRRFSRIGAVAAIMAASACSTEPGVNQPTASEPGGLVGPTDTLAVGESVVGTIRNGLGDATALTLTAGDTIDIGAFRETGLSQVSLASAADPRRGERDLPLPVEVGQQDRIYAGIVVPATGVYVLRAVASPAQTCSGGCNWTGTYTLRTRRSAPVVEIEKGYTQPLHAPAAVGALIGITIRNAGAGKVVASASQSSSATTLIPGEIELVGPNATATLELRANDGVQAGSFDDTITVNVAGVAGDAWSGPDVRRWVYWVRLHEDGPRVQLSWPPALLTTSPSGDLILSHGKTLHKFDPATQTTVPWRSELPGFAIGGGNGIVFDQKGAMYATLRITTDNSLWNLYRIDADGSATMLLPAIRTARIAVTPDGTVYFLSEGLHRVVPETKTSVLVKALEPVVTNGLAFHPADSALYYTVGDKMRRWELRTQSETEVGTVRGVSGAVTVGPDGNLYTPVGWDIVVMDRQGNVLEKRLPPPFLSDFTFVADRIYGTDYNGMLWSIPSTRP